MTNMHVMSVIQTTQISTHSVFAQEKTTDHRVREEGIKWGGIKEGGSEASG